ncbi:Hcp family type VI secretion system effector [Vibrio parahaemolyticus]|nr:Hcp family type VI secretion system effector [Vibrio parahaemolyticus]
MSHLAYMKITGKKQDLISKGCNSHDSIGSRAQIEHLDEISVFASQHDLSKFSPNTPKENGAFTITKLIDKASPLLGSAFSDQEHLECEIYFYRLNDAGFNQLFYTIKLHQAVVSSISFNQPHVNFSSDEEIHEVISFRYKDIVWEHKVSGTEGYDIW